MSAEALSLLRISFSICLMRFYNKIVLSWTEPIRVFSYLFFQFQEWKEFVIVSRLAQSIFAIAKLQCEFVQECKDVIIKWRQHYHNVHG